MPAFPYKCFGEEKKKDRYITTPSATILCIKQSLEPCHQSAVKNVRNEWTTS